MPTSFVEFLQHEIVRHDNQLKFNKDLIDIDEGGLEVQVREELKKEVSASAFDVIKDRISAPNILNQVTNKLTQIYKEPPKREGNSESDNDLIEYYKKALSVDEVFEEGNRLLNLNKYFAFMFYTLAGEPSVRILDASQFIVLDLSSHGQESVDVFIRVLGRDKSEEGYAEGTQATRYEAWTADSIYYFQLGDTEGRREENPYGFIPVVFGKGRSKQLMPTPSYDDRSIPKVIAKKLTDVNYAEQFLSHSLLYGIDLELPDRLKIGPSSLLNLKSDGDENKQGQIGSVNPAVDSDKVNRNIQNTMEIWLGTKGLKTNAGVNLTSESGVAKVIDAADATSAITKQKKVFYKIERQFWNTLSALHNFWVGEGFLRDQGLGLFSEDFEVSVSFQDTLLIEEKKTKLERLEIQFRLGLIDRRGALEELYPDLSSEEIDALEDRITESMQNDRQMGINNGQSSSGAETNFNTEQSNRRPEEGSGSSDS